MAGRLSASHVSPSVTVPLCMSSTRLGVTNENAGSDPEARSLANCVYGTSKLTFGPCRCRRCGLQYERPLKYGGGLCRTAYSPTFLRSQSAGMDSSYAFQLSPWPKMLGAVVEQRLDGVQSLTKGASDVSARPEVAAT